MADIFLSYDSDDRDRIRPIVSALEAEGWSVFWDRRTPIGQTWRRYLEEKLEQARCVLVVWTENSVQSQWVIAEADHGLEGNCLVPLMLDGARPPFGFRHLQCADLTHWSGARNDREWLELLGAIRGFLPADPDAGTRSEPPRQPDKPPATASGPAWAHELGEDEYGRYADLRVAGVTQRMRWIEPGEFLMGSPEEEPGRSDTEGPQHRVVFGQGFWLADTACTQALWQAVMGGNPSGFGVDPQNPVESLSWDDVQPFLKTLNKQQPGLAARLPSEAEWEYACRAGTTTPFWWGDTITTGQANYDGSAYNNGETGEYREKTLPVKSFAPNRWGLYQMHGNVWEWCQDCWHDNYLEAPNDGAAWEEAHAGDCSRRVLRGGSWIHDPDDARAAHRGGLSPGYRNLGVGFRVLCSGPS